MRRGLSIAAVVIAVPAAGLLAGCGGGSVAPQRIPVAENLVTDRDIHAAPPGSPQRSLLIWWRAVQYSDLPGYVKVLAPALRRQRTKDGRARFDVQLSQGTFIPSKPELVKSVVNGNHATLYTRINVRQPVGASRTYTTSYPQAFTFVRVHDAWRLADDLYIEQKANAAAAAVAQANKAKSTAPSG